MREATAGSSDSMAAWAVLLFAAPLLEETVFRLGLHAWLLERWGRAARRFILGPSRANVAVAVCFAAAHLLRLEPAMAASVVVPALLVGHLYEVTGRLWPCMLAHAVFNLLWLTALRST